MALAECKDKSGKYGYDRKVKSTTNLRANWKEKKEMSKSFAQRARIISFMIVATLMLAACGGAGASASNKLVDVQVTLSEFKIESSQATFSVGTPYHFVIKNAGTVAHDWMIMPRGATDTTKALIAVSDTELTPGTTVTRDFTFSQAGDLEFACHVTGHYEAGMKLDIVVK